MENKIYLQKLFNKKAEENNTIDLNAYALGLIDSKANEMLEMLKNWVNQYDGHGDFLTSELLKKTRELVKQATEI